MRLTADFIRLAGHDHIFTSQHRGSLFRDVLREQQIRHLGSSHLAHRLPQINGSKRMTEEKLSSNVCAPPDSEQGKQASLWATVRQALANPFEGTLDQLARRIRNETLLFVIAICIILVTVLAVAGNAPSLRFIAAVIALLALIAIFVNFVQEERKRRRLSPAASLPSSREKSEAVIESKNAQRFWQPFVEAAEPGEGILQRSRDLLDNCGVKYCLLGSGSSVAGSAEDRTGIVREKADASSQ